MVVAALEPQSTRKLEVGSGLTDELAEMAAVMERQQALVRRGDAAGVPVRVIANPSADLADDVRRAQPGHRPAVRRGLGRRRGRRRVVAAAECPAALVATHVGELVAGTAVRATWNGEPDGDEALVLGLPARRRRWPAPSTRVGTGRRWPGVESALAERGIMLAGRQPGRPAAAPDPRPGRRAL